MSRTGDNYMFGVNMEELKVDHGDAEHDGDDDDDYGDDHDDDHDDDDDDLAGARRDELEVVP